MTRRAQAVVWALAVALAAIGLALAIGGGVLALAGGSLYYLPVGVALLLTALELARRRAGAVYLFSAVLVATIAWSLWEVGLAGWALAPRLGLLAALGLLFLARPVSEATDYTTRWWVGGPVLVIALLILIAGARAFIPAEKLPHTARVETQQDIQPDWRHWGRTLSGDRYSPLAQIDTGNVNHLQLAWQYRSDVPPFGSFGSHAFQATPLAANDRLYLCVDRNVVVALDQDTGVEAWRFDPKLNLDGVFVTTCRGVAYFEAPPETQDCPQRILFGTADGRLLAVDAHTGKPCDSFGTDGAVDLRAGMGELPPGSTAVTSPPTIVNGVAVIGQFVSDFLSHHDSPSGVVRGYDAQSGELRWAWDAGRPDHAGLPREGEHYTRDTPNAWSVFSGDETLGLVYVPTGNSPPDNFGANRSAAAEQYSSAVVALDVKTGKPRWSFQTVHHDLWDYDLAAQPVVVDLPGPQGVVPALFVPTKRGQVFVLDRRDGTPVDTVVEKPVPQGAVPEDWTAATQPYTTGFAPVAGPTLRERDMWGLTPVDQLWCRISFRQSRYAGEFTPPGLDTHISYPGSAGGINWGSVAVDTDRGLMVVNTLHMAELGRQVPRAEASQLNAELPRHILHYPQEKTPYAFWRSIFLSPLGVPCQQPPYGRISVFDIDSRELLWSQPFGTAMRSGPWGLQTLLPIRMGVPNIGGAVATAGGVFFIGAAQDRFLRAYDIGNGRELWRAALPAVAGATPMTYLSQKSGRQYVVIAAGGHPGIPGPVDGSILAFALPE